MSDPYVGEIRMFAGNFAPAGWFFCDGSLQAISEYETLFNLIGTTFGGDGQSTFALPDLRSRMSMHQGNGYVLGEQGGAETVTLTTQTMPGHTHLPQASNSPATDPNPQGNVWASFSDAQYSDQSANTTLAPGAVGSNGGSQPHENRAPYVGISFIISAFGIFPTQN
ncbi:MAG: phage Tail Collar domain protein [Marmoricola sp.]|nr:phage Tail Collar domain protein [Marmoricola sp.]